MLAHQSFSILGQWDSALASAIIPSVPIRHLSKLQHGKCIDGVTYVQQSTVISLYQH